MDRLIELHDIAVENGANDVMIVKDGKEEQLVPYIQGEVILEVEVFADGTVGAIEVRKSLMSGPGGLDEAAIKSVKQWIFQPAKSSGRAVAVWVTFPVTFTLE